MQKKFSGNNKSKFIIFLVLFLFFTTYLSSISIYSASFELLKNNSFEKTTGKLPPNWETYSYVKSNNNSLVSFKKTNPHSGKSYLVLTNKTENDFRIMQKVKVNSGKYYKLSGFVKAVNIPDNKTQAGANLSFLGKLDTSIQIKGTSIDWNYVELYAKIGDNTDTITITAGIGGYGSMTIGKAYFDDISLKQVNEIPKGVLVSKIGEPTIINNQTNASVDYHSTDNNLKNIAIAILIILSVVFAFLYFKEKNQLKIEVSSEEENT